MHKMERNFLSKRFTSSGTESGIFCVADGKKTSGSTMGEMLGKGDWRQLGPLLYKQTVLGWILELQ
jgi:hypothetical protein